MARRGYTAILRKLKLLTVDTFRVQVGNGLENNFFPAFLPGFNPGLTYVAVVRTHTGGYADIQLKHRRDINHCLKLSVYF